MNEVTICDVASCDRPSDGWIVCKTCGEDLRAALHELAAWLLDDLELVISRAVRYSTGGGGSKSAETPVLFNVKASDVSHGLVNEVVTTARMIADDNGLELPIGGGREAAAWLHGEVSRVRLHVAGGQMVGDLIDRYETAQRIVDRPLHRQALCPCDQGDCPGTIRARSGDLEARCDTCGTTWDADKLRGYLVAAFRGRLVTAAEFARMSTFMGVTPDRAQVRKMVNRWHNKGRVEGVPSGDGGDTRFRFSDLEPLLWQDEARRTA